MLFKARNNRAKKLGAAYSVTEGCFRTVKRADASQETDGCEIVLVVIVAESYTNKKDVPSCTPTINFGGGICDPDANTMAVYKQLNEMRSKAFSKFRPLLQKILTSCITTKQYRFNVKDPEPCPPDYETKALQAIKKIDSTMDGLGPLEWTPGLVFASKEANEQISKQGPYGQSFALSKVFRLANLEHYGSSGQAPSAMLLSGDNTPENAVARLLIDNFDNVATGMLLNASVTQVGLSVNQQSGTIILDSGFKTAEAHRICETEKIIPEKSGSFGEKLTDFVASLMK